MMLRYWQGNSGFVPFTCVYVVSYVYSPSSGEMAEWLKAHAWKVCIR